jgi:hypothetical protein
MQEIKDLEDETVHVEQLIAKEKFRLFCFRWKILNKVTKLKRFDKDSDEFMRASLEI